MAEQAKNNNADASYQLVLTQPCITPVVTVTVAFNINIGGIEFNIVPAHSLRRRLSSFVMTSSKPIRHDVVTR